jgi:hypothetical protein
VEDSNFETSGPGSASANPVSILPEACKDPALLNDWHVVAVCGDIVPGKLFPLMLLERELAGWRDAAGQVLSGRIYAFIEGRGCRRVSSATTGSSAPTMDGIMMVRRDVC